MRGVGTFLAILLFVSPQAHGLELYKSDHFSLNLKGYYKNLYFTSKRQATDTWFHADLNRIRTEWDAEFLKIFSAKVVWDNELIAGNFVQTEEFGVRQARRSDPYLDLDYEIVREKNFYYGQGFHRAVLKIDPGPFILTVGRQRIGWGVMPLLSPADLFTQLPTFAVEKDEIVGVTAANLEIPIGSSLRINPVYVIHPDFDRSSIAGRIVKTVGRFDLSVLGGKFLQDEIFGFGFAGDVKKAGVRGEFIFDRAEASRNFVQGAVGFDYGFENTFYIGMEYFFDGLGAGGVAAITPFSVPGVQIQTRHKHFLGLMLKYDITPLWIVMHQAVVDLEGGSAFLNPETKYFVFSWLELTAGAQLPFGKGGGEFTAIPNLYYFQTQLFF